MLLGAWKCEPREGLNERMATLTKVEKAGIREKAASRVREGNERKDDEYNEKREARTENTSRGEKSPGQRHDLLNTICRCVSTLLCTLSLPLSLPSVKTRIFHSDVLAAHRVIAVAAVNEDAAIKCCAAGPE